MEISKMKARKCRRLQVAEGATLRTDDRPELL
jgi:hypothetical protein